MITARDMAVGAVARPLAAPALPPPMPMPAAVLAPATAVQSFRERILLVVLFVTVFASSIAFIEPSPHDALMGVLAIAALIAGIRFQRILVVPLILLIIWNASGLMSLMRVAEQEKTIQYAATSVYLAIAALLFACLFAQNTMQRLETMRIAYVLTAILGSITGMVGYFHMFPGAGDLFAPIGRALGMFKDPNVFGPFLIWPALILIERMVVRRFRFVDLAAMGIILFGLMLSFSRGAWFHFAVSAAIMISITFLTVPDDKTRMRIVSLTVLSVVALAGLVVLLLSFSAIGDMFTERAQLIQRYDVGRGGRFRLQELAVTDVLKFPNGMGPFEFARVHGQQQHNVYLQAFLVYGWTGAMAYILLILSTLFIGLRTVFVRTPWQPYLITAYAVFVGEVVEGFVIDTDHWRHFFLLLGMVWGLAAATLRQTRQAPVNPYGASRA